MNCSVDTCRITYIICLISTKYWKGLCVIISKLRSGMYIFLLYSLTIAQSLPSQFHITVVTVKTTTLLITFIWHQEWLWAPLKVLYSTSCIWFMLVVVIINQNIFTLSYINKVLKRFVCHNFKVEIRDVYIFAIFFNYCSMVKNNWTGL
jgi:hypothetical protein